MVPIATPLESVAMHIVQSPGIGRVAADPSSTAEGWAGFAAVVGLAFEVRLVTAEFVAEGRGGGSSGTTGVLPLGFSREAEFPALGQGAGFLGKRGELPAKEFNFREVHVADGEIIIDGQLGGGRRGKTSHHFCPERLSGFELGHPETLAKRDEDLILAGTAFGFVGRAAHDKLAGWAPAELNAEEVGFCSGF